MFCKRVLERREERKQLPTVSMVSGRVILACHGDAAKAKSFLYELEDDLKYKGHTV